MNKSKQHERQTLFDKDTLNELYHRYNNARSEEKRMGIFQQIRAYKILKTNPHEEIFKRQILEQIEEEQVRAMFHPTAKLFPLMEEKELIELTRDIKKNGLNHDIVMYEGKILSGRNRYKACIKGNVEPRFRDLEEGIDPLAFIISENLHRRNLKRYNSAIRCSIALALLDEEREKARKRQVATQLDGKTKNNDPKFKSSVVVTESPTEEHDQKGRSIEIVAKRMGLSPTTLKKAVKITNVAKNDQEIAKQWEQAKEGKISINKVHEHATRNKSTIDLKQDTMKKVLKSMTKDIDSLALFSHEDPSLQKAILFLKKAKKILSIKSSVVVTESSTEEMKNTSEPLSGSSPDGSIKSTKKMKGE